MRSLSTWLLVGGAIYALSRRFRRQHEEFDELDDLQVGGITDVDPQPLTTVVEAVDPDAIEKAHAVPQRLESLPRLFK